MQGNKSIHITKDVINLKVGVFEEGKNNLLDYLLNIIELMDITSVKQLLQAETA